MNHRLLIVLIIILAVLVMIFLAADLSPRSPLPAGTSAPDSSTEDSVTSGDVLEQLVTEEQATEPIDIDAAFEEFDTLLEELDS